MTLCNRTRIRRERVSRDACLSLLYPSRCSHTHPSRHRGLASTYGDGLSLFLGQCHMVAQSGDTSSHALTDSTRVIGQVYGCRPLRDRRCDPVGALVVLAWIFEWKSRQPRWLAARGYRSALWRSRTPNIVFAAKGSWGALSASDRGQRRWPLRDAKRGHDRLSVRLSDSAMLSVVKRTVSAGPTRKCYFANRAIRPKRGALCPISKTAD
jgi:hypothetical protein